MVMEHATLPSPPHADTAEDDDLLMDTPLAAEAPALGGHAHPGFLPLPVGTLILP